MKSIFAILTAVLSLLVCQIAIAQSAARRVAEPRIAAAARPRISKAPADIPDPPMLLKSAIATLESHRSITAKIRQQVDLFGHHLVGSGSYWQQGKGADRLLRLELKIEVADQISSLQQVCDGRYLWIHQDLVSEATLGRVDLSRIRAASQRQSSSSGRASDWLAIGGLPRLLASIDSSFRFTTAERGKLDRLQVWTLEGEWTAAKLAQMLPEQKQKILAGQEPELGKLADHIPDRVVLKVGRDDLFPYRIEYRRRAPSGTQRSTMPEGKLLVVMEFFEVQFDSPIDPGKFVYKPGEAKFVDETASFLTSLGLEEGSATEARRAEAPRR